MQQPRRHSSPAHAHHLEQLTAAIDAHRAGRQRCRLPLSLRAQVLALIDAGAPVDAVRKACKLSAWQIASWRQVADSSSDEAAVTSAAALESPRVLSVVDHPSAREHAPIDAEIELRIGGWRVSLRRETP